MTVTTSVRTAGPYVGNGAVSTYVFAFKVFLPTDVLVQLVSAAGVLSTGTLGTDYSVSLNPFQDGNPGGVVILAVPLPAGATLTIGSQVPLTQTVVLTNPGGFYPQIISDSLDKITILIQQALGSISGALRIPEIGSSAQILPAAAQRANMILSFDSNGNPITVAPVNQSATALAITLAASTGAALVGYIQAATGAVLRTVLDKLRETVSVADFGTVGDGVADDTVAIQAALNWCSANGKRLEFSPPGVYLVSALTTSYNSFIRTLTIDLHGSTLKSKGTSANPLFEILNARSVKISNGVLDGDHSLVQSVLAKIWANNGTTGSSYNVLENISFRNAQYGVQAGDLARPNEPYVAENRVIGCDCIGVLNPAIVFGVQGELNIIGSEMTASIEGWSSYPAGYVVNALTAVGGNIRMTGGEITSYVTNGVAIRPIVSAFGNLYGKVLCSGVVCETQERLAVAENPSAIASPVGGLISFIGCFGAAAITDNFATIDSAADYRGDIVVSDNYFYSSILRTKPNINAPTGATVRVDSKSFNPWLGTVPANGAGFKSGIGGFTGGTILYDSVAVQTALLVQQSGAQSLPNGAWTKIQLQNEIFDTANVFDTATYRFTPAAGYYQINAQLQVAITNAPCAVDLYKNGVSTGYTVGGWQSSLNASASISRLMFMNGTDYLELYGLQNSGAAANSVPAITQMSISYTRAA